MLVFQIRHTLSWFGVKIFRIQDFQFSVLVLWFFSFESLTSQHLFEALKSKTRVSRLLILDLQSFVVPLISS